MLMTWKIWKSLRYPLRWHPIFRQTHTHYEHSEQNTLFWRMIQTVVGIAILLFVVMFPAPALITGFGLSLGIPALILVFNGSFLGLKWVTSVSEILAKAYQDKRFDLLALTPRGALGVSWLMCTATIHRHDWLRIAYRILRWVLLLVLVLLGVIVAGIILSAASTINPFLNDNQLRILIDAIGIAFVVLALWLDHIQSIVIASIMGILLPSYLPNSWQVRELARFLYILLQVMTYLFMIGVYFLLEKLIMLVFATQIYSGVLHFAATVLLFYLLRELIINLLWRSLLKRFDLRAQDYQEIVT